jgi:DHA1 family inner membrane transport protein
LKVIELTWFGNNLSKEVTLTRTVEAFTPQNQAHAFWGISLQIIGTVFFARMIIDVGTRMLFPFIPQFSTGLGLTVVGFGWLLFFRALVNVSGPIFGMLSDRYGRRKLMAIGLLCQAIGTVGLALSWQWWATLPMIFSGIGLAMFLPAQQAYIGDQVTYERRGRAMVAVEFSWAMVAIVLLPIIGWMIDAFGWRSPFLALGMFSLLGSAIVWWRLPPATERHSQRDFSRSKIQTILFRSSSLATLGASLLVFLAVSSFMTVWGIWLATDFKFGATAVGMVATGIGVAELAGSVMSSLFIDRIGKRWGSGLGLLLMIFALALLPLTQGDLLWAVAMLIIIGAIFEFTIVSLIPLYSEQVPQARGTVLSLMVLGMGIGGSIGTPIATHLWEQQGLWAVCSVAIICLLITFGIVWKYLMEEHTGQESSKS